MFCDNICTKIRILLCKFHKLHCYKIWSLRQTIFKHIRYCTFLLFDREILLIQLSFHFIDLYIFWCEFLSWSFHIIYHKIDTLKLLVCLLILFEELIFVDSFPSHCPENYHRRNFYLILSIFWTFKVSLRLSALIDNLWDVLARILRRKSFGK